MKRVHIVKSLSILFVIIVAGSGTVFGQLQNLKQGDSIRISAPTLADSLLYGTLDSYDTNWILMMDIDTADPQRIYLQNISSLEFAHEKSRAGKGTLIGAGAGALLMGMVGLLSYKSCNPERDPGDFEWFSCSSLNFSRGELFLGGAALGLLPGALIGAIIGSTEKYTKWQNIDLGNASSKGPSVLNLNVRLDQQVRGLSVQ